MIDRIRLTAAAKIQLSTIKRKTGIEHYNSICRHALCLSLENFSTPPVEEFNLTSGIEIDWRIFTGGNESVYSNIIIARMLRDGVEFSTEAFRMTCMAHVHRGLSYLVGQDDDYLLKLIDGE